MSWRNVGDWGGGSEVKKPFFYLLLSAIAVPLHFTSLLCANIHAIIKFKGQSNLALLEAKGKEAADQAAKLATIPRCV